MKVLVSVFDKTGIVDFCKELVRLNHEIISTGGTAAVLTENKIPFIPIEQITGNPECFDGRMKTISFQVGAGLLFRRENEKDEIELKRLGLSPIDMVVCNLYPFSETAKKNPTLSTLIEMIDIGGPTMIRAAAKNYAAVTVLTSPSDYESVLSEIKLKGSTLLETRQRLALKAFEMTSSYDLAIQLELSSKLKVQVSLPKLSGEEKVLRYGENPHQKAKLCVLKNSNSRETLASAPVLQGKEISFNNYLDADSALKCVSELKLIFPDYCSVVIVKHGTPCGVAVARSMDQALEEAWQCDSISAFGGIIALSDVVDEKTSLFFDKKFIEVLLAPSYEKEALQRFSEKKNLRLIQVPLKKEDSQEFVVKSIHGGVLIQEEDEMVASFKNIQIKNGEEFSKLDEKIILFGQTIIKYLKSNCLALVERTSDDVFRVVASGVGQPNRLECLTKLIGPKIKHRDISKAVLVSDAFFPFRDSIDSANQLGIKYIVEPGGSVRDDEVIQAAKQYGIQLAFTGERHFRH